MRLSLLPLTAGLVCATGCAERHSPVEPVSVATPGATTAAQRQPIDVDETPFTIPAGLFCEFDILVEPSGKAKTIDLPGERSIFLSPGLKWTLTNEDNEKQVTLGITGAFHVRTLDNGDVETVVTGRNILGDPEAGLVLAIGRFSFVFDTEGNLVQPLRGKGRLIDLCELLA